MGNKNRSTDTDMLKRMDEYDKDHCWQYDIRLTNAKTDLEECNLTEDDVKDLRTEDFEFRIVETDRGRQSLKEFIRKHEWLGTISQQTTHWFGAYYKGILAGTILMNIPNAFSKSIGEETKELERLISRGACISWSPKNLASNFLMWSIRWMVQNTQYRLFSAYSDPTAKELGTIYQACNWYYIGQIAGATRRYVNPYNGKLMSDRQFRIPTLYKKYAEELRIPWNKNYCYNLSMVWDNVPDAAEEILREMARKKQAEAVSYPLPLKHKYIYVLGKTKKETKQLKKKLESLNKIYPYPKDRGSWEKPEIAFTSEIKPEFDIDDLF